MNSKVMRSEVNRLKAIYEHPLWIECDEIISKYEETRIFCKHNKEHLMDVARIAYIYVLEEGLDIKKDVIYAAALLHDIGRAQEYRDGIPHDVSGVELAYKILHESAFSDEEKQVIIEAIRGHRGAGSENRLKNLSDVLKAADKKSRMCLYCEARAECYWPQEKKNDEITY